MHAFCALTLLDGHQEELVDHPCRVTFSEEVRASSQAGVITPTVCLHFAWCTTSLRVGGLAARPSCLASLLHGGSGHPTQSDAECMCLAVRPTQFIPTKQSSLCCVWCGAVKWTVAINAFRLHIFCLRQS